jgi:pyruvate-ferredoxin/flavodoxin oxidoreductase
MGDVVCKLSSRGDGFSLIAQATTLRSRVPFLHIFDGFRTSHEVMKIEKLSDDTIREMIDEQLVQAHRGRALTRQTSNAWVGSKPDVFFQSRERTNSLYLTFGIVEEEMSRFGLLTGRNYKLFEYVGDRKPKE